ncbi:RNA methyltransferase [Patescibacteria group bacterium]|nr:RNA methyltransferase [Patescibacteria group bacterium]
MQDIIVVLDNIRSLHNVGAIFRTCDGAGVKKIYLCGMTGVPPRREITKTAIGAEETIDWEYRKSSVRLVRHLKKQGYKIVALEKNKKSKNFHETKYGSPLCLVVGHEINGIKEKILQDADLTVHIPMRGLKESLNVATAFGIAIYEITR